MMSIIAIALTFVAIFILSYLVEMDVTVKASGEIISDFGSRDAIAPSAGENH